MMTWPDIANAVSQLSQHLCVFRKEHVAEVKRRSCATCAALYCADGYAWLHGCWHAGNHATRRCMTGYIFALNGTTISGQWQGVVSLVICEAEYIAMAETAKEALWLRTFLQELGFDGESMLVIGDNQSALKWAESKEYRRTKHIPSGFCAMSSRMGVSSWNMSWRVITWLTLWRKRSSGSDSNVFVRWWDWLCAINSSGV